MAGKEQNSVKGKRMGHFNCTLNRGHLNKGAAMPLQMTCERS